MSCVNINTNVEGIPYLSTANIAVTSTAVNLSLGFRRIQPVGLFFVRVSAAIPEGTTTTLPVSLTLNGITRPLTTFGGEAVTVAQLTGTGVIAVFNDRYNGILQVVSPVITTQA